jgi:hypothetical protein
MLDVSTFQKHSEHKCAHVFKMDNGNYFMLIQTTELVWMDNAWTYNRISENPGYHNRP